MHVRRDGNIEIFLRIVVLRVNNAKRENSGIMFYSIRKERAKNVTKKPKHFSVFKMEHISFGTKFYNARLFSHFSQVCTRRKLPQFFHKQLKYSNEPCLVYDAEIGRCTLIIKSEITGL